ncbi:MAG: hypothetical protein J6P61_09795, partial [Erysipelotrichaceae bacterium]|nr:hypothetical protein [Erysipelotrichaceae bacterium]
VPNATFDFTITPVDADNIVDSNDTQLSVLKGIPGATISSASFTPESTSYTTVQEGDESVTLANNQKYAKSEVTVDFSQVTFNEPGVYRYKITEQATNEPGMTNDENPDRYLDVFVTSDDDGNLTIANTILHTNNDAVLTDGSNPEGKPDSYTNIYQTYDLALSKTVTGNQAYRQQYFPFTVTISQADPLVKYDITNVDASVTIDGTSYSNPVSITTDENGEATFTLYLKHGQCASINGLTATTTYSITEEQRDYTASIVINDGDTINDVATSSQTITTDTTVAYTNERNGIIPTGVVMNNGPILAIMGIALAGCAVLIFATRTKKDND